MAEAATPLPWVHPATMWVVGAFGVLSATLSAIIPKGTNKKGRSHAVITGGSSGIGLALAKECALQGFANITLIARNKDRLEKAKKAVETKDCKVHTVSLDVAKAEDVEKAIKKLVEAVGVPDVVFSNAGEGIARTFEDTDPTEFERLMQINYLGCVYITKAVLPSMKKNGGGTVVFTSSMAGQAGIFGYTAYSPTKFALQGFAEALQMEVRRDNISVVLTFPPDTDTPAFKEELKDRPRETQLIGETAGLFDPKVVAETITRKCLGRNPPFCVYFGLEGWMLCTLAAGMSPVHGLVDCLCQVVLMSLLRFVSLFCLSYFTRIIAKFGKEQKAKKE